MRHAILAYALLAAAPLHAVQEGTGWSIVRLDLDVVLDPDQQSIVLEGEMRLTLDVESSPGPTLAINGRSPILSFLQVEVHGAQVELNARHPARPPTRLVHVRFPEAKTRGDEVVVRFVAEGEGASNQLIVNQRGALASWVEVWYPIAAPASGETLSKKSTCSGRTRFHLPPGWSAVSNGRLVEREEADDGAVETWETDIAVARSFAAGEYRAARHMVGEREVGVYRLTGDPEEAQSQVEAIAKVLAALEARFGPYPYPSYHIVEVADGNFYASSEQGLILAKAGGFGWDDGNLALFGHELAHGWWGNSVANDGPGGILLTESICQYGAVVAIETIEGEAAATDFLRFSRPGYVELQCARGFFEMWRRGFDRPLAVIGGGGWNHQLSDAKGHWVYHMLRRRIGDEAFFGVWRDAAETLKGKAWTLQDMRARFVAAAPDAGLETFFEQWLERPGAPFLAADWSDASAGGEHRVEVVIRQEQGGSPYVLHLDVDVQTNAGTERHLVEIDETTTRIVLPLKAAPTGVLLDPEYRVLRWDPEYGESPIQ